MSTPMACPSCKADLTGSEIPEKDRVYYGGHSHFSNAIGLYDRKKDRTTHWKCPDCKHVWARE